MCKTRQLSVVIVLACWFTTSALAWEAFRWGSSGGAWVPTQDNGIRVIEPGTYKFYATTGGTGGALAEINRLDVDPEIGAGLVKVYILRDPTTGGGPGCTDLGGIDLTGASSSQIAECRVANDAATLTGLTFDKLSGPCDVAGSIENAVTMDGGVRAPRLVVP
jgi:hypothetical protein